MFSQLEATLLWESGYILQERANYFLILFSPNLTEVTFFPPLAGTTECLHKSRRVKAVLFHPVKVCLQYQPPWCLAHSKPDSKPSTGAPLLLQSEVPIVLSSSSAGRAGCQFLHFSYLLQICKMQTETTSFMFTNVWSKWQSKCLITKHISSKRIGRYTAL